MLTTLALLFVLSCNFVATTSAATLGAADAVVAQNDAQYNASVRITALKSARQVVAIWAAEGKPRIEENTPEFEAVVKACEVKVRELVTQQARELEARLHESAQDAAARDAHERALAARRKPVSQRTNREIRELSGAAIGHMASATVSAGYKTLAVAWNYILAPTGGAAWNHVLAPAGRRVGSWLSGFISASDGVGPDVPAVAQAHVPVDVNVVRQDIDLFTVAGRLLARRAAAQVQE